MDFNITGATRLNVIIGDPIAQVKSPAGMTAAFAARDHDAVVAPVRVSPEDLKDFLTVATRLKNLDGIIVTVPHKFACHAHCSSATERGDFLGAVNIMRRRKDGGWHGEMVDGLGFVGAVKAAGYDPSGKRALLIGAGGAGSAIALALVDAGVRELAIHDADATRRDRLIERLNARNKATILAGSPDPTGFDLVANATPAGMKPGDALPVDVAKLSPSTFVGCVVTVPAVSPLIETARKLGCRTSTGTEMYQALQTAMVEFLLAGEKLD
ncbi:shikimate dehydrogenase family protein [Bosea psychrotolerans]|uniref:Shikimate dehydrogenase n=1 Tax=Bosea psychrotolerans TaxID=1871628 RepID=A0A2S4MH28_9HYPH|nr:shikimate dehydrogenase [Bosea psychrotolerans]POR54058.1 shikimate dehydrogenase [Bosea psychrotolerans]